MVIFLSAELQLGDYCGDWLMGSVERVFIH